MANTSALQTGMPSASTNPNFISTYGVSTVNNYLLSIGVDMHEMTDTHIRQALESPDSKIKKIISIGLAWQLNAQEEQEFVRISLIMHYKHLKEEEAAELEELEEAKDEKQSENINSTAELDSLRKKQTELVKDYQTNQNKLIELSNEHATISEEVQKSMETVFERQTKAVIKNVEEWLEKNKDYPNYDEVVEKLNEFKEALAREAAAAKQLYDMVAQAEDNPAKRATLFKRRMVMQQFKLFMVLKSFVDLTGDTQIAGERVGLKFVAFEKAYDEELNIQLKKFEENAHMRQQVVTDLKEQAKQYRAIVVKIEEITEEKEHTEVAKHFGAAPTIPRLTSGTD